MSQIKDIVGITIVSRKTKRVLSTVFISVIVIFGLCGAWVYNNLSAPSRELNNQLRTLIQNHDPAAMKRLSYDDNTYKFLSNLSVNAAVAATDFQGGGPLGPNVEVGYFPAQVAGTPLYCYMVQKVSKIALYPKWKLVKVSTSSVSVPIDPKWVDDIR